MQELVRACDARCSDCAIEELFATATRRGVTTYYMPYPLTQRRHLTPVRNGLLHTRCFVRLKDGKVESRFADLYVPKVCTPEFVKKVGNEPDAMNLVARLQGMQFQLTGCTQAFRRLHTHMIRTLFSKGASRAHIALASRLTRRQVRRLCAGITPGATADSEALLAALMELDAWRFLINAEPLRTQYDDAGRLQE